MLKRTIAVTGLFVAVGGGMITSVPASARAIANDNHYSSSHSRNLGFRHYHRNRNANWTSDESLNRIRIPVTSTNNVSPTVNVSRAPQPQVVQAVPAM
jgi:hypothetical protein